MKRLNAHVASTAIAALLYGVLHIQVQVLVQTAEEAKRQHKNASICTSELRTVVQYPESQEEEALLEATGNIVYVRSMYCNMLRSLRFDCEAAALRNEEAGGFCGRVFVLDERPERLPQLFLREQKRRGSLLCLAERAWG
jgi:hypothetical protein